MSVEEELTVDERRKYLKKVRQRYHAADKAGKGLLLCEAQEVTGLHRKSLERLLRGDWDRHPSMARRGRT